MLTINHFNPLWLAPRPPQAVVCRPTPPSRQARAACRQLGVRGAAGRAAADQAFVETGKQGILLESIGERDPRVPGRPDPDLVVQAGEVRHAYRIIIIDLRGGAGK